MMKILYAWYEQLSKQISQVITVMLLDDVALKFHALKFHASNLQPSRHQTNSHVATERTALAFRRCFKFATNAWWSEILPFPI